MKHKMTIEEQDLRDFITQFLSLHGVKPKDANEIEFLDAEGLSIEGLHIDIDCQIAPLPDACPLCGLSKSEKSSTSRNESAMSLGTEKASGESDAIPDMKDVAEHDTEEEVMSMAAIRSASRQLEQERSRKRSQTPPRTYMPGESDIPPGPRGV